MSRKKRIYKLLSNELKDFSLVPKYISCALQRVNRQAYEAASEP